MYRLSKNACHFTFYPYLECISDTPETVIVGYGNEN